MEEKSPQELFEEYRATAFRGDAQAQLRLAECYERGYGTPTDCGKAMLWYSFAAEQGLAEAQYQLAWIYLRGLGTKSDAAESVRLFRLAADGGDLRALCALAGCYFRGTGTEKDPAKAVQLYTRAAQAGSAEGYTKEWDIGGKVTLTDILVLESLNATAKSVAEMLQGEEKESEEDPTGEKLHEMMEQAAKEICDE